MKTYAQALFLAIPLAIAPVALAQHQTFHVNPDASQVAFALGGSGHHVEGTFHVQSGSIDFDPGAQKISGFVVVAAVWRLAPELWGSRKVVAPAAPGIV